MAKHYHQFFKIKDKLEYDNTGPVSRVKREGVQVVCTLCGEVRETWNDGRVEIIVRKDGFTSDIT